MIKSNWLRYQVQNLQIGLEFLLGLLKSNWRN